ncbi:hypothetical protein Hanom_Chr16g01434731 [Helianthus anomalus]
MSYIIDSVRGNKESDYLLTSEIKDAFDMPFNWEMVKQTSGWECGFMVTKHMYEFVTSIQYDFHNNVSFFIYNDIMLHLLIIK